MMAYVITKMWAQIEFKDPPGQHDEAYRDEAVKALLSL